MDMFERDGLMGPTRIYKVIRTRWRAPSHNPHDLSRSAPNQAKKTALQSFQRQVGKS